MKKFIALAIAVVMLAALAVPCFAATTGETIVEYPVAEAYSFVVPARVVLVKDAEVEGKITVDSYSLIEGNKVVVTAESTWTLNDPDETEFQFDKVEFEFTEAGDQIFKVSFVDGAPTIPTEDPYRASVTFTGAIVNA